MYWELPCSSFQLIAHKTVRDLASAWQVHLSADFFSAMIEQLVQIIQYNNSGTVHTGIDATNQVTNFGAMPELILDPGHSLAWYLDVVCRKAQELYPTTRPRWFMDTGRDFGVGTSFGPPVLHIYDAALTPLPAYIFAGAPISPVTERQIMGEGDNIQSSWQRRLDASQLVQRAQSRRPSPSGLVRTYAVSASQSLYPNPFINHSGTGNTGYWMNEPVEDADSVTLAEQDARLKALVDPIAYPMERITFLVQELVQVGEVVQVDYDLESIDHINYRVMGARDDFSDALSVWTSLDLNSRRLELLEDGTEIGAPPYEVPWDVPAQPIWVVDPDWLLKNSYDPTTHLTEIQVEWNDLGENDLRGHRVQTKTADTLVGLGAVPWIDQPFVEWNSGTGVKATMHMTPDYYVGIQLIARDIRGRELVPSATKTLQAAPAYQPDAPTNFANGSTPDSTPERWGAGQAKYRWTRPTPLPHHYRIYQYLSDFGTPTDDPGATVYDNIPGANNGFVGREGLIPGYTYRAIIWAVDQWGTKPDPAYSATFYMPLPMLDRLSNGDFEKYDGTALAADRFDEWQFLTVGLPEIVRDDTAKLHGTYAVRVTGAFAGDTVRFLSYPVRVSDILAGTANLNAMTVGPQIPQDRGRVRLRAFVHPQLV